MNLFLVLLKPCWLLAFDMVMFGSVMAYVAILCVLKCVVRRFYGWELVLVAYVFFWLVLQIYVF